MRSAFRTMAFLGGGLLAGFAIASLMRSESPDSQWAEATGEPLAARVGDLERRLASETEARIALSAEIDALQEQLEAGSAALAPGNEQTEPDRTARLSGSGAGVGGPGESEADASRTRDLAESVERARRTMPTPEQLAQRRVQRFVDAGFAPDRAEWIERRTAEVQMQALEEQYEAARSGEPENARALPSTDDVLRTELGDVEYERYLTALGRPTSIGVRNVLPSSPAEQAGLQPGDELVAYDGRRVFDLEDLNRLTLEGRPGESVALQVLRDGQPMQIYVPRGPIGVFGGGGRRRP